MIDRPASQLDSLALSSWPIVDLVRVPGDLWWCVIVGRGRRRCEDNHSRTACGRIIIVTTPGREVVFGAGDYRTFALRDDICVRCRPARVEKQLELGL